MDIKRNENSWAAALGLPENHYTNTVIYEEINRIGLIKFRPFCDFDFIVHGFSTRIGGVSKEEFAAMNLSFTRGDDAACVSRNSELIGEVLNTAPEEMVSTHQTHTVNVCEVGERHRGIGITRKQSFCDIDGFVTDTKMFAL